MPAIYQNMPFTVEGRMTDPDNFPNNFLSYTWSILSQPIGSKLVFLNSNSVTPSVIVDTPGNYQVELVAFDGASFGTATYTFSAAGSWGASAYLSGSCASTGSGLSTTVQVVYANATSIISQNDANQKAASSASYALLSVLNCCPASIKLGIPSDAPSGSRYEVVVLPADFNPSEDYIYNDGNSFAFFVGSGTKAGSTVELVPYLSEKNAFLLNTPFNMEISVQEPEFATGVIEDITNFDLAVTPQAGGSISGLTVTKVQKKSTIYPAGDPVNPSRALGYLLSIPQPISTRATIAISNRIPPLSPWQVDANGWDWVVGSTANALGLFVLTGGTRAAPTSEALVMAMNTTNSEPNILDSFYNFYGYSQIPYQGSLYGYNDRLAFSSIPHTGFVNTTPSTIQSWVSYLLNYVQAHNISYPVNAYFRAGVFSSGTYTWTASSVPLYLERNDGGVSLGSLVAGSGILAATNSVLIIAATAKTIYPAFFATVRGAPVAMFDMYRFSVGFPTAVQVGVYNLNQWPNPTSATRLFAITPNAIAGRGYDVTNLATNSTIKNNLSTNGYAAMAFYLEDASNNPIANSFPISITSLTTNSPTSPMYSTGGMIPTGPAPAGTNNVLVLNNAGTKVYVSNSSS